MAGIGTIRRTRRFGLLVIAAVAVLASVGVASVQAAPPSGSGNWTLKFSDDFTNLGLDTSKWNPAWNGGADGNGTSDISGECPSPEMASQPGDGYLHLAVKAIPITCKYFNPATQKIETISRSARGGVVSSESKYHFSYGYVEWKVVLPGATKAGYKCPASGCIANWPSFWSRSPGGLTEIDQMDTLDEGKPCPRYHRFYPGPHVEWGECPTATSGPGAGGGEHTYAVRWEPGVVTWYYDNQKVYELPWYQVTSEAHYLLASYLPTRATAKWGPPLVPEEAKVDYVKVWQHPSPPTVTINPASNVSATSAIISGTMNPNGVDGRYKFECGPTGSGYTMFSSPEGTYVPVGSSPVNVSWTLSGLSPLTSYTCRLEGNNVGGATYSGTQTFTTNTYGSPSVILDQSNDQMWVHSRHPTTGKLRFANWSPSTPWTTTDLGNPVRPGTTPSAIFDDSSKLQWIFYVHTNGDIGYRTWDGTVWKENGLTAPKQVAPGTSPVAVLDQTDNQRWVWWVDTSGILNYWNWSPNTGVWTNYSMGTVVAPGTSPTVTLNQTTKEQSVFYVKPDMSIGQWRWAAGQPWHQGSLGGPVRAGTSPTALYDQKTGQQWVFYVNQNGDIAWWNLPPGGTEWKPYSRTGPVRPNTNLSVTYDPSDSQTWLWFVHTNGDIVCWNWKASTNWVSFSLTGPGPVSPGTSLAPVLDLKTKEQWVHYRNAGGENSYWNWTSSGNWKHYGS